MSFFWSYQTNVVFIPIDNNWSRFNFRDEEIFAESSKAIETFSRHWKPTFSVSYAEEGRKKKLGKKKKKKLLKKLFMLGMLLKSKFSFLLQLFHAHLQVKFFVIAVLGLLINAGRFWIELKKSHQPNKVVYYEHAQHQHHYEHDEDQGYWGRSFETDPQKLAFSAHAPQAEN